MENINNKNQRRRQRSRSSFNNNNKDDTYNYQSKNKFDKNAEPNKPNQRWRDEKNLNRFDQSAEPNSNNKPNQRWRDEKNLNRFDQGAEPNSNNKPNQRWRDEKNLNRFDQGAEPYSNNKPNQRWRDEKNPNRFDQGAESYSNNKPNQRWRDEKNLNRFDQGAESYSNNKPNQRWRDEKNPNRFDQGAEPNSNNKPNQRWRDEKNLNRFDQVAEPYSNNKPNQRWRDEKNLNRFDQVADPYSNNKPNQRWRDEKNPNRFDQVAEPYSNNKPNQRWRDEKNPNRFDQGAEPYSNNKPNQRWRDEKNPNRFDKNKRFLSTNANTEPQKSRDVPEVNHSSFHQHNKREPRISFKLVSDLLDTSNPTDIVFKFCNPHFGLDNYLYADTLDEQFAHNFLYLFEKALSCNSMDGKLYMLSKKFSESKFFSKHVYDAIQNRDPLTFGYNIKFIRTTMNVCAKMIEINTDTLDNLSFLKDRIELFIRARINNEELTKEFESGLGRVAENAFRKIQERTNRAVQDTMKTAAPEDFREMSILPRFSDLLTDQMPFLRKNLTNGAYKSVHDYLDVQFRLLREDYLGPLRDGVVKIRKIMNYTEMSKINQQTGEISKDAMKQIKGIGSLNVYFKVKMNTMVLTDHGIVNAIQLDLNKLKSVNWEHARRLMFGSLVCLSSDFFASDCMIGVVCERDPKLLAKSGIIHVRFNLDPFDINSNYIDNLSTTNVCFSNKTFIMLETSAFFESYRHVLEALVYFSRLDENEFPFKENLVDCKNQIIPMPDYLRNATIDLRPIVDTLKIFRDGDYIFSPLSEYAEKCYLSNEASWPTAAQMNLDTSQYEAVKLALQNKLTLIQGPPGTGKTYIGVKIVQLLLHNKHTWWNRPQDQRNRPILMVCYTNHALDQFLEYCMDECNLTSGVIRVGGRSTSARLEPFLLSNVKRQSRVKVDIHYRTRDEKFNLVNIKNKIDGIKKILDNVVNNRVVVNYSILKNFMREEHANQFENQHLEFNGINDRDSTEYSLLDWLGILNITSNEPKTFEENENNEAEDNDANYNEAGNNENTETKDDNEDSSNKTEKESEDVESDTDLAENDNRMLDDDMKFLDEIANAERSASLEQLKNNTKINLFSSKGEYFYYLMNLEEINFMFVTFNAYHNNLDNSWTRVDRNNKKKQVDYEVIMKNMEYLYANKVNIDTDFDNDDLENIWRIDYEQRSQIYFSWVDKFIKDQLQEINKLEENYNISAKTLQELRLQEDRTVMQDAFIIAMTTTGSSRYHKILQDIGPRIVIVEEAAEVFEAHVVTSLSKHCEHLILIGDHVQLRPNPTVYTLAKNFNLDVSLFERLINNDTKKVMLSCQHRMNPEISRLMKYFYDSPIKDHESVNSYPKIIGLYNNIFFFNHNHPEKEQTESTSKVNLFEAEFIAKLCEYFIKQKYDPTKITVLSMYLGQMMEIKKILKRMNISSIKCSTVDNYQGEENNIVILSLVRSNNIEDKIGFLSINNRVCVALSRAKHGFYCIGNFDFIVSKNKKWRSIVDEVNLSKSFGNSIKLTCGKHPKKDIDCSKLEHFDQRKNGGCELPCNYRLKCGHVCALRCHTYDDEHNDYECPKKCDKMMNCGHKCQQKCSHEGECKKCEIKVDKIIPECKHIMKIRCDKEPSQRMCNIQCNKLLPCSHLCLRACKETDCMNLPCLKLFQKTSPCHHNSKINVYCSDPEWTYREKCTEICNQTLDCGHICKNKCSECNGGYLHGKCKEKCDRVLFCGHTCAAPCANQCQLCQKKCKNSCPHSNCAKKCSEPCVPCREHCAWQCEHKQCTKECHELCDREPCDEPCNKTLKCGHKCIGLCGELCPRLCRICHKNRVTEIFFGTEDEPDAKFIFLKDCNHIVESTGMDNWVKSSDSNLKLPECPRCRTPITKSLRYSNYIKDQLNAIETIKKKQFGDKQLIKTEKIELITSIITRQDPTVNRIVLNELIKNKKEEILKHITNDPDRFEKIFTSELLKIHPSFNQLASYKNTWNIHVKLDSFYKDVVDKFTDYKDYPLRLSYEINKIKGYIYDQKNEALILNNTNRIENIIKETERVEYLLRYLEYEKRLASPDSKSFYIQADSDRISIALFNLKELLINKINRLDDKIKRMIDENFDLLKTLVSFKLTDQERIMIVNAIGLQKGHWFKCPNGHVYCIGECGGAMQQSKCPECGAVIGGQNHALESGNTLASEMDGAQNAAWSNTANFLAGLNIND